MRNRVQPLCPRFPFYQAHFIVDGQENQDANGKKGEGNVFLFASVVLYSFANPFVEVLPLQVLLVGHVLVHLDHGEDDERNQTECIVISLFLK